LIALNVRNYAKHLHQKAAKFHISSQKIFYCNEILALAVDLPDKYEKLPSKHISHSPASTLEGV